MAEGELAKRFGELVRRLTQDQGLSQEEFSFRVGVDRMYLVSIEQGKRNVTIGTSHKLAKALGSILAGLFTKLEKDPDRSKGV